MKACISIKYHADHRNKTDIEKISLALEQSGFETICIVRDIEQWGQVTLESRTLMQLTFSEIDSSDVLIVDLTEKGVGLGIEAGYAYANGIPIITIAHKGSNISATLAGISQQIFFYDKIAELVSFFKSNVAYRLMSQDKVCETEALEWAEATIKDVSDVAQ
jgi:nucleoside 2-deoxyribosyltransferase